MKKSCLALTALLVSVGSLAAQGAKESSQDFRASKPIPVEMWYQALHSEVGPLPKDWAGYQRIREQLNIDLTCNSLPTNPADQDMKIQAAAAADQLPDFFATGREVFLNLVRDGMVADVTDLYQFMPNRVANQFDEDAIAYSTVNGRSYGFATPSSISRNEGLLIRKDWLDNLGLKAPTTLDELYEVMRAFTFDDPDGNGRKDTYGFGAFVQTNTYESYPGRRFEPIMGAFGVEGCWDMHESSFGLMIHKPEFYDFMVFMRKCIADGLVDPNWMAYKKDDFRAAWKQGKFGVFREQYAAYSAMNNYAPFDANFPDGDFIIADAPIGKQGKSSIGPEVPQKRILCISSKSADKGEAIAKMLEWFNTGEGYHLLGWGVEGVNYTMKDGLHYNIPGDLGYEGPIGQTYTQLGNLAYNYDEQNPSDIYQAPTSHKTMNTHDVLVQMQSKKWTSTPGQGLMPNPSTDLKSFYEHSLAQFLSGNTELTADAWAKFIKQFDEMGGKAWEAQGYEFAKANNYLQK